MHEALSHRSVASLDSAALARRLGELAGAERRVQADFLLHLEAFDRRRGYLDAGYASLWEFCLKALHLREGAAGRRIAAMRVLRRFPVLESALREGRLCLSTLGLLGPVLTEENLNEVVERAAFRRRTEVDRLVASMQPRAAPKDGIRRLTGPHLTAPEEVTLFAGDDVRRGCALEAAQPVPLSSPSVAAAAADEQSILPAPKATSMAPALLAAAAATPREEPPSHGSRSRPSFRPLSEESYSLRVTLDAAFKGELDQLRQLLSHKVPSGDLAAVLREAVRCAIEKHGKRRGAVAPSRKAASPGRPRAVSRPLGGKAESPVAPSRAAEAPPGAVEVTAGYIGPAKPEPPSSQRSAAQSRPAIPAALRREVWVRDRGQCTWRGKDGHRCESRWQLEFDHAIPVALGGPTTAANLRLTCRAHNGFHAEQVFGRDHMARYRREATRQGELAIASGGGR
ncbi:MAG TPA: HNH endonuclease [Anaeromyxobacteraceae bacterium]|jgi:hypothetical protein|nr:HNH endonuclease [Anaeromyxobacteraceae bacterium]